MKNDMKSCRPIFIIILILSAIISCDGLKMPRNIFETSERVKYERSFSGADSLLVKWKSNFSSAANNQLNIADDFVSTVSVSNSDISALGYSLELKKGDKLIVEAKTENLAPKIFVDIIDKNSGSDKTESHIIKNQMFTKIAENSGIYKIVIQPEIDYRGTFQLKIYTQPSLGFPVAGKGNSSVQSFWGASRDGGGRSHEGIDIFASRGTPVVAIADGFVTRTGNQGLGGKQVWLRDGLLGNSYYYAHLDSILTESGKKVKTGDTLGLVGNTGNAKGGATHLHFGIYTSRGAVDPYPFVRKRSVPSDPKNSTIKNYSERYIKAGSNLRTGPGTQYDIVSNIGSKTSVKVLSFSGSWYHVKVQNGAEGFITAARLE